MFVFNNSVMFQLEIHWQYITAISDIYLTRFAKHIAVFKLQIIKNIQGNACFPTLFVYKKADDAWWVVWRGVRPYFSQPLEPYITVKPKYNIKFFFE